MSAGDFESRFSVALERHEQSAVVRPTGELDSDTAQELERAMSAVQAPGRRVVLDLRGLRSATADAVPPIVAALDRAEEMGAELRVLAGPATLRLLDDAGVAGRLGD